MASDDSNILITRATRFSFLIIIHSIMTEVAMKIMREVAMKIMTEVAMKIMTEVAMKIMTEVAKNSTMRRFIRLQIKIHICNFRVLNELIPPA